MTDYICKVGGVVAPARGRLPAGICSKIKCGSDDCGYDQVCEHQERKPCTECGGKIVGVTSPDLDSWFECEDCGVTI